MDGHLDVVPVGDGERVVDDRGRRAPVLVDLERGGAGHDLFVEGLGAAAVALGHDTEVDRQVLGGLKDAGQVEGARGAGRAVGAVGGSGAAAEERGDAVAEGLLALLRRDEVDVGVHRPGGGDQVLPGDDLGARADDQARVHAVLGLRVAGLADARDEPVLDADVALDHAEHRVHDHGVGDDQVQGALGGGGLGVGGHAVAHRLAAAVHHLVPVRALAHVLLDLYDEIGVGEPEPVAHGGAEEVGVLLAGEGRHVSGIPSCSSWPRSCPSPRPCGRWARR